MSISQVIILDIWFFEKTREIEWKKFNLYLPQQLFYERSLQNYLIANIF